MISCLAVLGAVTVSSDIDRQRYAAIGRALADPKRLCVLESLASGEHQAGDLVDRVRQIAVEAAPALAFGVEQGGEPRVDPIREAAEGRRRRP